MSSASLFGAKAWLALSGENPDRRVLASCRGIGLVRSEYVVRRCGKAWQDASCAAALHEYLRLVVDAAGTRQVWYRFTDLEARDVNVLQANANVVHDDNPLLGMRGARRYRRFPDEFTAELDAVAEVAHGAPNLGFVVPFVRDAEEFGEVLSVIRGRGIANPVGVMVEVPSAALTVADFLSAGAGCLLVGLNDLTGLTLGSARSDPRFNSAHSAVRELITHIWRTANAEKVACRIAGNYPAATVAEFTEIPLEAWTVHYADWARLVDPAIGGYRDQDLILRYRHASDAKLVRSGAMHSSNTVVAAGLRLDDAR